MNWYLINLYFYAKPYKNAAWLRMPTSNEWLHWISKKEAYFHFAIPTFELPKCESCNKILPLEEKDRFVCLICEMESFFK